MIDLRKPYQWEEINDRLKDQLQTSYQVRFYQSLQQALLETVMGFQSLYSHKRQFASSIGLGTHADDAILFLSRQGIKNLDAYAEAAADEKKNLVHILDLDDAITAEVYQQKYNFDEKLFRISMSHHLHFFTKNPPALKETEVLIWSLPEGAIAFHGKRCTSVPMVIAPTLQTTLFPTLPLQQKTENKTWVQSAEAQSFCGSRPLSGLSNERIFDRAFFCWEDLEAEALRQTLIADFSLGAENLEALSLSRWNELKLIAQFEKRGWSPEMFRGTLIVSAQLASDKDLFKKIETSAQKLRARGTI